MQYNPPTGGAANDGYVGKNVAAGIQGSKVPPGAAEFPQRELVNIITDVGMAPTNADLAQASQAIRSGKLNFFLDQGTADALLIKPGRAYADVGAGTELSILKGNSANASTTPTLTVSGATLTIVREDGSALAPGDLPANCLFTVRSDGTHLHVQGLRKGEVVGSITKQQILNITGGVGFSGSKKIQTYQPSSPSSQTISQEFTAPARGTVLVFSTASSTAQSGLANYATITVNGAVAASTGDSVGGSINDVAVAQVNTGDDVIASSMIVNSQALTYNVSQQLNFLFFPS